jgi:hypothetical protein
VRIKQCDQFIELLVGFEHGAADTI